ncbi:hypothetical protein R6Q57_010091, partial [Mikania cordata]
MPVLWAFAQASDNDVILSAINFQASGLQHYKAPSSQSIPFETAFLSSGKASSVGKPIQCPRSVLRGKRICCCLRESNYRDARRRIDELTSDLEHLKSQLSKSKIQADMRKSKIGIGFTKVKPPFNHNYSIMPNINTSVDDLLLKSDQREVSSKLNPNCEPFVPTGSLEQASTSSSSGHSDCDVKPFDPKEFHEK